MSLLFGIVAAGARMFVVDVVNLCPRPKAVHMLCRHADPDGHGLAIPADAGGLADMIPGQIHRSAGAKGIALLRGQGDRGIIGGALLGPGLPARRRGVPCRDG